MKKLIFIIGFFLIATNADAMFQVQEEHLHFLNIESGTGTTSADIIYPHNPPDGHSISSIAWTSAPGGVGGDIILECKPTATSTATTTERFKTNNNTFGQILTQFYCPYHIFLTCTKSCWVGITSWAGNYQTKQGTSLISPTISTSTISSSTVNFMSSSSIENITYSAIETDLGGGRTQIDGQYNIPMALYAFVVSIILFLMVIIYLFNRKKWS